MRLDHRHLASRHPLWLIVALGGTLLSSCAEPRARSAGSSTLLGEWRSGCTRIGKGGRHGAVFTLRFDGRGTMLARTRMFARVDCARPTLEVEAVADYVLGERSGSAVPIDYTFRRVEMTLLGADVAAIYNSKPFARCAKGEWRPGVPQSVLGGFCPPTRMPGAGSVQRDTAFLGGRTLAFGDFPLGLGAAVDRARPAPPSHVVFTEVSRRRRQP